MIILVIIFFFVIRQFLIFRFFSRIFMSLSNENVIFNQRIFIFSLKLFGSCTNIQIVILLFGFFSELIHKFTKFLFSVSLFSGIHFFITNETEEDCVNNQVKKRC